jgi:Sulfatase
VTESLTVEISGSCRRRRPANPRSAELYRQNTWSNRSRPDSREEYARAQITSLLFDFRTDDFSRYDDFHPPVLLAPRRAGVVRNRIRRAHSRRGDGARGQLLRDQEFAHGFRSLLRKLQIELIGSGAIGVSLLKEGDSELLQASLDFIDKSVKSGKPFFLWHNNTRMHVFTRLSPEWENKSGYGLYADGMMELDWVVGQLLKKLDDLGIADNTIVVLTSDNGAEKFSWPDGGTEPFRGEKGTTWEGGFRVPCVARWPGVIKPNTIINDIASHEDWTPTFLAAAGVPDVKQQLLAGYKGVDRTFKVDLDGYDMTDVLSGKGPGQRKEIFYFDDSGSLNAFRYGDWKVSFATKDSWWADVAKPRTIPLVVNLRQDPFEVTPDSQMYARWYADKLWVLMPAQAIVGQFLMTFKEFPQRQKSASFNIQQILDQMRAQTD